MKDVKHTYYNCSIYGDKGYIGADVQLDLFETAHIRLECPYRLNQKDWKPTYIPFAKARKRYALNYFRQQVLSTFVFSVKVNTNL